MKKTNRHEGRASEHRRAGNGEDEQAQGQIEKRGDHLSARLPVTGRIRGRTRFIPPDPPVLATRATSCRLSRPAARMASAQIKHQLEQVGAPRRLHGQAQHNQAEAEIVGLGQGRAGGYGYRGSGSGRASRLQRRSAPPPSSRW